MTNSRVSRALVLAVAAVIPVSMASCGGGEQQIQSGTPVEPAERQDNGIEINVACATDLTLDDVNSADVTDDRYIQRRIIKVDGSDIELASSKDGTTGWEKGQSASHFLAHNTTGSLFLPPKPKANVVQDKKIQQVDGIDRTFIFVPGKVNPADPDIKEKIQFSVKFSGDANVKALKAFMKGTEQNNAAVTLDVTQSVNKTADIIVTPAPGETPDVTSRVSIDGKAKDAKLPALANGTYLLQLPSGTQTLASVLVLHKDQACMATAQRGPINPPVMRR